MNGSYCYWVVTVDDDQCVVIIYGRSIKLSLFSMFSIYLVNSCDVLRTWATKLRFLEQQYWYQLQLIQCHFCARVSFCFCFQVENLAWVETQLMQFMLFMLYTWSSGPSQTHVLQLNLDKLFCIGMRSELPIGFDGFCLLNGLHEVNIDVQRWSLYW